ncbi:MAG: tRNA (adenosine(37)-N6)-threonylcarbamoyltransferase complex dimerization subunit type 1 TsaB [Prosthecobacter sp.]|nr:tRNA (adenosine(37)-N6)-threonylcarbamoyltransferase complex dimerization subunit type 1 TsaB [Prosthecobacter sp.]
MTSRTTLALDLSTARGEIAVVRGDSLLFADAFQSERSHNAQVFVPLRRALAAAGPQLDLIVIGSGPGSYTGVRIAIAAAQGIALSRKIPLIGWPSIAAPDSDRQTFQVIGDARRGCFYIARITDGHLVTPIEILDAAQAKARVEAQAAITWLTFDSKVPFDLPAIQLVHPSAARLARAGLTLSATDLNSHTALPLEPLYLQEAFITTARKPGKQVPIIRALMSTEH